MVVVLVAVVVVVGTDGSVVRFAVVLGAAGFTVRLNVIVLLLLLLSSSSSSTAVSSSVSVVVVAAGSPMS